MNFSHLMAADGANDSIDSLCLSHPTLVNSLSLFESHSAINLIASLETIPHLMDNTIRVELLLHLAARTCKGTKKATAADLKVWFELVSASPFTSQEDPTEGVFVGYVCTPNGGYRVFPGIFSYSDSVLERLLSFLRKKIDFPSFSEAYNSVLELLKLSDSIAGELSLNRYTLDDCSTESRTLPPDAQLQRHIQAVHFDAAKLDGHGIKSEQLAPFIFDLSDVEKFGHEKLFGSSIERHPLIKTSSELIVASPASLCRAGIIHILHTTPNLGSWADTFFGTESAEFFCNQILKRLGIKTISGIKLPTSPSTLPPLYPVVGQFDHGMSVLALTKSSRITDPGDLEELDVMSDAQEVDLANYISQCCAVCESLKGFKGGMVLLALSSAGKSTFITLNEIPPKWRFFAAELAEWETLAVDQEFSAKRLWYLGQQEELARKSNIQILNPGGLLNLYGFWKKQSYALIPLSFNPRSPNNLLVIGGDFSRQITTQLRFTNDRHCRLFADGVTWIQVQRQGTGLNPDLSVHRIYCDYSAATSGFLRGCIAYNSVSWWIESKQRPANSRLFNLAYRLWDCVLCWAERVVLLLCEEQQSWIPDILRIQLDYRDIDRWDISSVSSPQEPSEQADLSITFLEGALCLKFEQAFLGRFYRQDNLAEREIVAALIRGAAKVSNFNISDFVVEECTRRIAKDENSRFFHIMEASTLEAILAPPESAQPVFVPEEEMARVSLGLAFIADNNPPERIIEAEQARLFIDDVVAGIQKRLCSRLTQFWMLPVVSYSFSQLDELSRDSSRWSLSTRSLLSLENNAEWLRDRLRNESGRSAMAEIANRALIETAVYSHNPTAKEIISQTEHASLLAEVAAMITLANYRDAIATGFVKADITIHPNGVIQYDDSFQVEVVQPYLKSRIDDNIQWNADDYGTNFKEADTHKQLAQEVPEETAFKKAFLAEFGISFDVLPRIVEIFEGFAVKSGQAGGTLSSLEFMQLLKNGLGLSDSQVEMFISRFALPIRPAWNKKLPKGCDANDVLPWRYFRGLSILVRPFVEISRSPRQFAISAPHLHRWYRYLAQSILEGYLPEKFFQSTEMKRYLGTVAHKKGHEFTVKVAAVIEKEIPHLRAEINMTELGAPQEPDLGDIDILAWIASKGLVFLVECKRLKAALTVRQVIQQVEEFRGDPSSPTDYLFKHQRRIDWLKANPSKIAKLTNIPAEMIQWRPLLVTSGRVPMSYLDAVNFSRDQVIPFQDLAMRISTLSGEC